MYQCSWYICYINISVLFYYSVSVWVIHLIYKYYNSMFWCSVSVRVIYMCFTPLCHHKYYNSLVLLQCISVSDIYVLYSFVSSRQLTFDDMRELSPALLYSMMKTDCDHADSNDTHHSEERVRPQPLAGTVFCLIKRQKHTYGFFSFMYSP